MDKNFRITGYAIVLGLLFFAGWFGTVVTREILHPDRIVQVRFTQLGTLKVEDPVVESGVRVGRIKSIKLKEGFPQVGIEFFHNGFIAADSRFLDFNQSLMGARMIVLRPGHSDIPMDESQIQDGVFADGIAERIHRISGLLTQVSELRSKTNELFIGPDAPLSPKLFGQLEKDTEKLNHLASQVTEAGKSIQSGLQVWQQTATAIRKPLHSPFQIDTAEKSLALTLKTALSAEQKADVALASAEQLLALFRDSTGMVAGLMNSRAAYNELENSLHFLESALDALQKRGIGDAVKWRNVHFFRSGTE